MDSIKRNIARRDFLTSIGRVAGSAAMLRTMAALGLGMGAGAGGSSAGAPGTAVTPPPPPGRLQSPRPGDWPANVGVGKSVAILGSGIAGMTTALEMTKLGYDCTILEATKDVRKTPQR
jgi:monoamine oxidase